MHEKEQTVSGLVVVGKLCTIAQQETSANMVDIKAIRLLVWRNKTISFNFYFFILVT